MQRADKERLVAELTDRLRSAETLIVADYRGLTVAGIDKLRGNLLAQGARFSVVKNTLTRRAAEAAGIEPLLPLVDGPTAIAFLESGGDPVAVAKALDEAVRAKVLVIKGGLLEGSEVSAEAVARLAKLPQAELLRAQLVGAIIGPAATVVGLFTAPARDLVGVLDARIRQLEEEAPSDEPLPAEEPEPAAEPEAQAEPEAEQEEELEPEKKEGEE